MFNVYVYVYGYNFDFQHFMGQITVKIYSYVYDILVRLRMT